jgi:hypothetical protein
MVAGAVAAVATAVEDAALSRSTGFVVGRSPLLLFHAANRAASVAAAAANTVGCSFSFASVCIWVRVVWDGGAG